MQRVWKYYITQLVCEIQWQPVGIHVLPLMVEGNVHFFFQREILVTKVYDIMQYDAVMFVFSLGKTEQTCWHFSFLEEHVVLDKQLNSEA